MLSKVNRTKQILELAFHSRILLIRRNFVLTVNTCENNSLNLLPFAARAFSLKKIAPNSGIYKQLLKSEKVSSWDDVLALQKLLLQTSKNGGTVQWNLDGTQLKNVVELLQLARLHHRWDLGFKVIARFAAELKPSELLEAGHFLAEYRCRFEDCLSDDFTKMCENVKERASAIRNLPLFISTPLRSFLSYATGEVFSNDSPEHFDSGTVKIVKKNEAATFHALRALLTPVQARSWENFERLFPQEHPSLPTTPARLAAVMLFFCRLSEHQQAMLRVRISEWLYNHLTSKNAAVDADSWLVLTMMNRFLDIKVTQCSIEENRLLSLNEERKCGTLPPFNLPEYFVEKCRNMLNKTLEDLAVSRGSISSEEITIAREKVQKMKQSAHRRGKNNLIVVDSLNVALGGLNPSEKMATLTARLFEEYGNVIFVTKKGPLSKFLEKRKWPGDFQIFYADKHSEDDILVLLAALEWGSSAWIISNDRYTDHISKIGQHCSSAATADFDAWMRARVLRFDPIKWVAEEKRSYSRVVQPTIEGLSGKSSTKRFFVPVYTHTGHIPKFSFYCVTFG